MAYIFLRIEGINLMHVIFLKCLSHFPTLFVSHQYQLSMRIQKNVEISVFQNIDETSFSY